MEELSAIYERMRDTFAEEAGFVPNDGCDAMVRLYALASEVQSLLAQADWVLDQSFPQTAQGQYLDYHAQSRGLTRSAATKATGTLRFSTTSAATADYAIPLGTVVMTAEGVKFETTEAAAIETGETYVDVTARAVEGGVSGNVIANKIRLLSVYPMGVTGCTNQAAFAGGSDAENDEELRERILDSYKRLPNGANAAFYEQEAMSVPTVASAKAVGRARGIGTVDVYVTTQSGTPSQALLDEIAAIIETKREIAVDVDICAPTAVPVNVSAQISVGSGYTFASVKNAAEAAVRAYFTGERLGECILAAKLNAIIYGVEGVENVHLLTPSADVSIFATQLPTLGTLSLTQIGA